MMRGVTWEVIGKHEIQTKICLTARHQYLMLALVI